MDTEEDMEEMEIAFNKEDTGAFNRVLEWTTSDVVSVDNDISGVEPLEMTNEHKVRLCLDNISFVTHCCKGDRRSEPQLCL